MVTEKDRYSTRKDNLRLEMFSAFKDVAEQIEGSNYEKRSKKLDSTQGPNYKYKQNVVELTARAFESYIISKSESSGNKNDFLVKKWDTTKSGTDIYEYLEPEEMAAMEPLLDNLFKTIKARQESDRTVLLITKLKVLMLHWLMMPSVTKW
jgi:frataxin-like iron-binding protein CyaY